MIQRKRRLATVRLPLTLLLAFALHCLLLMPVFSNADVIKREVRMGRQGAIEIEKQHKVLTDPKLTERVERLGQAIAEVANSEVVEAGYGSSEIYRFEYKFKVLDSEDVNAFSLPGGFVYVNKGLLNYAQSDHELAGVLAHEIAHASHRHMTHLLKEQSKLDTRIALLLLVGMLARVDSNDLGNLMLGMQLVRIAKSSGYGQKAEQDADATAVEYLVKAGFNPVGMLTFMERLARDYIGRPNVEAGIMQTHPSPKHRCRAVLNQLKAMGLPINRRAVTDVLKAVVEPAEIEGRRIAQVKLGDNVLFEPAPIEDVLTSQQRAEAIAVKVNQLLDSEPVVREVTLSSDGSAVLARGEAVIVVTAEDSAFHHKPARQVASEAADVLKRTVWMEMIERLY